jgi:hypothetical protein
MAAVTLDMIRKGAGSHLYPRDLLDNASTALALFAAGFHGQQDVIWMAEAGLHVTCVDTDGEKLNEMILAYPEGWEYVTGDAFEYATLTQRTWDIVNIDAPSNLFDRCAELLPLWCLLARKTVVLGCGTTTELEPPAGWMVADKVHRSNNFGGTSWAVVERC